MIRHVTLGRLIVVGLFIVVGLGGFWIGYQEGRKSELMRASRAEVSARPPMCRDVWKCPTAEDLWASSDKLQSCRADTQRMAEAMAILWRRAKACQPF